MEQPIRIEDEVQFLDPQRLKISRNQFAELEAELPDGTVHAPVEPVRTFPLTQPNQYISLLDVHKNELGLIEDINQLEKADQTVLAEELEKCYFMPKITRIYFIEGRFGVTEWEAETDSGTVSFDLRSRNDITTFNGGRVLIKDIDGNRYEIVNYHQLDPQSVALLETQI
ncbi:DUF1854 domain-containing protein [Candidatus Poribacteria bacterium]|nr:DUF1854 domain-containing protein [Candidatus Poribacteria bacterium]